MGLMFGDVEVADAQREVDGIEILERRWKIRQVKREENEREEHGDRDAFNRASAFDRAFRARLKGSPSDRVRHAGRSNNPSFKLPVR